MTEQTPPSEPGPSAAPETAQPAAAQHHAVARIIARMSIPQMTLAVVLLVFLWQWFDAHRQLSDMRQELAERMAEMDGDNKANLALLKQEQEAVRELAAKESLLEAHFAESQSQRVALETLYQELSASRDENTLSEVEQLLLIAGQQLQLSANVKAALIAMQQADAYLGRMNRANLNSLRNIIGHDIDKLRAFPELDIPEINSSLDQLVAQVDTLPLAHEIRAPQNKNSPSPAPPNELPGQKLLREIWEDARHLLFLENTHQAELPLITPTQSFFLRENLKLRLLSARLALLERDEASFNHDLQAAQSWISLYFDPTSSDRASAIATLQKLRKSYITIELPDISDSLDAVRNYRLMHEKSSP
ncbi:MAG: uroporphyrinogen-III C-methyltransferase [Gallionellaceae bacterium]